MPPNEPRANLAWLTLFASVSTLFCCALPALLVALGMGAVVASVVAQVPALVWLSERKVAVFAVAGLLLVIAGFMQWQSRHAACPIDKEKARACMKLRSMNRLIYCFSVIVYVAGFFVAFVLPRIL